MFRNLILYFTGTDVFLLIVPGLNLIVLQFLFWFYPKGFWFLEGLKEPAASTEEVLDLKTSLLYFSPHSEQSSPSGCPQTLFIFNIYLNVSDLTSGGGVLVRPGGVATGSETTQWDPPKQHKETQKQTKRMKQQVESVKTFLRSSAFF